jgi:hypothetical protein
MTTAEQARLQAWRSTVLAYAGGGLAKCRTDVSTLRQLSVCLLQVEEAVRRARRNGSATGRARRTTRAGRPRARWPAKFLYLREHYPVAGFPETFGDFLRQSRTISIPRSSANPDKNVSFKKFQVLLDLLEAAVLSASFDNSIGGCLVHPRGHFKNPRGAKRPI